MIVLKKKAKNNHTSVTVINKVPIKINIVNWTVFPQCSDNIWVSSPGFLRARHGRFRLLVFCAEQNLKTSKKHYYYRNVRSMARGVEISGQFGRAPSGSCLSFSHFGSWAVLYPYLHNNTPIPLKSGATRDGHCTHHTHNIRKEGFCLVFFLHFSKLLYNLVQSRDEVATFHFSSLKHPGTENNQIYVPGKEKAQKFILWCMGACLNKMWEGSAVMNGAEYFFLLAFSLISIQKIIRGFLCLATRTYLYFSFKLNNVIHFSLFILWQCKCNKMR